MSNTNLLVFFMTHEWQDAQIGIGWGNSRKGCGSMAFDAFPAAIQTLVISSPQTTIYYPAVIGLADFAVQERINNAIANEVHKLIDQQLDPQQTEQTEMSGSYEIKTNERNVLSLSLLNYAYVQYAAHGLTIIKSLTLLRWLASIPDFCISNSGYHQREFSVGKDGSLLIHHPFILHK